MLFLQTVKNGRNLKPFCCTETALKKIWKITSQSAFLSYLQAVQGCLIALQGISKNSNRKRKLNSEEITELQIFSFWTSWCSVQGSISYHFGSYGRFDQRNAVCQLNLHNNQEKRAWGRAGFYHPGSSQSSRGIRHVNWGGLISVDGKQFSNLCFVDVLIETRCCRSSKDKWDNEGDVECRHVQYQLAGKRHQVERRRWFRLPRPRSEDTPWYSIGNCMCMICRLAHVL